MSEAPTTATQATATQAVADSDVRPSGSLLLRVLVASGVALAAGLVLLLVVFGPFLADTFAAESRELLREQEVQARSAAELDTDVTEQVIRSAVEASWRRSRDAVQAAPLELLRDDPEAARAALLEGLDARSRTAQESLDVLFAEVDRRKDAELREVLAQVGERHARRADAFGTQLSLRSGLMLVAVLAVLFLAQGAVLVRTVIDPVRRLSEATGAVAAGELGTRIDARGDDEVAALARSFNEMTGRLAEAHDELSELNQDLERRVEEKTAALSAALAESQEANRRLERALDDLAEKERELRHAEKMASLGTLAGGVAHEFNNLLGGILGCAEDAARETDPVELRETLGVIERAARRGEGITDNLLRFARPSSERVEELQATEVLSDVATLIEREAQRREVRVSVDCADDVTLRGDSSGLHQVLLNLATNALLAMPRGGDLTLAARQTTDDHLGPGTELSVTDTGTGIAPEHRARLFEPFFSTRGPEGTGLGLSVSYGIVQAHAGRIDVESEPGRGSVFRVFLPAHAPRPQRGDE